MTAPHRSIAWLLFAGALGLSTGASAGQFNARLKPGDPIAKWSQLPGADGRNHSLDDYRAARVLVLVFTCNHCPVAQAYEDRLIALDRDYRGRGVQLVAINCSRLEADRLPAMQQRAKARQFGFPYLFDDSQRTGKDYGVRVTPEVFVVDGQRRIAYLGAIDDAWQDAGQARKHYARDAIEALLAGRKPELAETKAVGCGIQFDD